MQSKPNWVWSTPEPLFQSSRYCVHDMFRVKVYTAEPNSWIVIGPDGQNPGFFICILKTDLDIFLQIEQKIQDVGNQFHNPYQPYIGEMCLVKCNDEKWCRCTFMGEKGGSIEVYAIDYGIKLFCTEEDIRVGRSWWELKKCNVNLVVTMFNFSQIMTYELSRLPIYSFLRRAGALGIGNLGN